MYQPTNLRLTALAFGLTLLFGTAACNRDKNDDASSIDTELRTNSEDQAEAENDDALLADAVEADTPADQSRTLPADSASSSLTTRGGCATRTWNPATRTLTIDFGTTNCLCLDGRYRRGVVQAVFTGARYQPGSSVVITRQNYFVNDNQHLGTKTLTYTDYNKWHVNVAGGQILFNGGGQVSWTCDRDVTRTAAPGVPTTLTVTGQAAGTNRRGIGYTAEIQSPLVKRKEYGCAGVFVAGTVQITRSNGKVALLNYNPTEATPAPCDRLASITVNGNTKQITLR